MNFKLQLLLIVSITTIYDTRAQINSEVEININKLYNISLSKGQSYKWLEQVSNFGRQRLMLH